MRFHRLDLCGDVVITADLSLSGLSYIHGASFVSSIALYAKTKQGQSREQINSQFIINAESIFPVKQKINYFFSHETQKYGRQTLTNHTLKVYRAPTNRVSAALIICTRHQPYEIDTLYYFTL